MSLTVIGTTVVVAAKGLEEYIGAAEKQRQSGYLQEAIQTMEEAVREFPASAQAHAYLGLYIGIRAGQSNDMAEAMDLVQKAFQVLDKAVSLDPQSLPARLHRGTLGVNVPEFFGKLDQGIDDLEFVIALCEKTPDQIPEEELVRAYDLLAAGYRKRGDLEQARAAWERIIRLAPASEMAKGAEESIRQLPALEEQQHQSATAQKPESATTQELREKLQKDPQNADLYTQMGQACLSDEDLEAAQNAFRQALHLDSANIIAFKGLAMTIREKASRGYDQRIYENTDLRTNLAFELAGILDQAVAVAPEDAQLRLWRGIVGVQMPFFVGKLDQGIEDLKMVAESDAPDSIKAESLYWLGLGYRKKSNTAWIEVVSQHADTPFAQRVFDVMSPRVTDFNPSDHVTPMVAIDFVLGFQDELGPQTAVWIEDADGHFVKTIYTSGFAGHVKERQITLPRWADASGFIDADAITGASIDVGHHIFVWDLKDSFGTKVPLGTYTVKVEVSYWPSMQYQLAEAMIQIAKKGQQTLAEKGNLIPYLKITYYP